MTVSIMQDDAELSANIQQYRFNGYCLDLARHCLFGANGEPIKLKYRAFDTLLTLVKNRGKTLSKQFLMDTVWQRTYVEDNNLNQAISNIRKALSDSKKDSQLIKTYAGKGYCFIGEVECIYDTEADSGNEGVSIDTRDVPDSSGSGLGKLFPQITSVHVSSLLFICLIVVLGYLVFPPAQVPLNTRISNPESELLLADLPQLEMDIIPDSVAVLPLELLSEKEENDFLAAGFQNELINQLAKVKGINLISKEGVLLPEIQQLSYIEMGRILRVEHLITGTIMLNQNDASISVQMINPANGIIAWADSYSIVRDRMPEMVTLYSEIALDIAEALEIDVNQSERSQILNQATNSFEAYRYNLAATHAYYSLDYGKSFRLSKKALALDPSFVNALTLFSKVNVALTATPLEGMKSSEHKKLALEAAERLITLFPENYDGYLQKATILATDSDWEGALQQVRKLNSMNVSLSELHFLAPVFISLGEFDTAINILEANLLVEPLNGFGRGFLITAYESAGQRVKARLEYDLGEELTPLWWGDTVNVFLALGRNEEVKNIDELFASEDVRDTLVKLQNGDVNAVHKALKKFQENPLLNSAELVYFAAFASSINDDKTALDLMNRAMDEQNLNLVWFWLPVFSKTTQQVAFRDMLDKHGILHYWEKNGASQYMEQWAQQ